MFKKRGFDSNYSAPSSNIIGIGESIINVANGQGYQVRRNSIGNQVNATDI